MNPARRGAGLQGRFLFGELLKIANGFFFAPNADHAGKYQAAVVGAKGDLSAAPFGLQKLRVGFRHLILFDHSSVVAEKPRHDVGGMPVSFLVFHVVIVKIRFG